MQGGAGICRDVQLQSDAFHQPLITSELLSSSHTAALALQVRLSISLNVVDLVAIYRHLAG
jgi:hypothetical protein